uniref:Uncharacterized protein n=1 Tax=Romanomermis culicivorax TaxID=13658 RepID=A0A915JZM9_ROMCU
TVAAAAAAPSKPIFSKSFDSSTNVLDESTTPVKLKNRTADFSPNRSLSPGAYLNRSQNAAAKNLNKSSSEKTSKQEQKRQQQQQQEKQQQQQQQGVSFPGDYHFVATAQV